MKKLTALLAVMLALVLALGVMPAVAETDDDVKEIVLFQHLGSDDRNDLLQSILDEGGLSNVKLTFVDATTDTVESKLQMMMQAGQKIDVLIDSDGTRSFMIDNGWTVNLDDYIASWDQWDLIEEKCREATYYKDGSLYGIPYGRLGRILFYRADWLEEAGLAVPTTWDELLDAGRALTDPENNRYGYSFRGGVATEGYFRMIHLGYYDHDLLDFTWGDVDIMKNGYTVWDDVEATTKALEFYKAVYDEISPPDSISWGYPEMVEAFYSGVTAFLIQDPEVIVTCEKYMEDGTWNTAVLPRTANGYIYTGGSNEGTTASICSMTDDVDLSWDVISTLFSYEGAIKYCEGYGCTPVYTAVEGYDSGYYQAYIDQNATGLFFPYRENHLDACTEEDDEWMEDAGGFRGCDVTIQRYVSGQSTAEDVCKTLQDFYGWMEDNEFIAQVRESYTED